MLVKRCEDQTRQIEGLSKIVEAILLMSSKPDRIVIDGRRLNATRTGVGRYLESLLAEWSASELPAEEVCVVLADRSGLERVPSSPGLTTEVAAPGLPGLLWERFGLATRLRPGDLLFAPTNLVPTAWRGPTVLVMFDALQEVRPGDFSRLVRLRFGGRYRRAIARADRVIVPSRATAIDLERVYDLSRERVAIVHPAADRAFRPCGGEVASPVAAPYFLFVGKRSRRRNVPAILAAFAIHRQRFSATRLVFVGDASATLVEADGVIDLGHVGEADLQALLAHATALLYPSEHEGFGLPVVEAMASGCPVVTLRREALLEAGGDGPLYLEEATPEAIANAMATLASDQVSRGDRVVAGLAASARFSPEAFAGGVSRELQRGWDEALSGVRRGTRR